VNGDTWWQGKGGQKDDMAGGGPMQIKDRVAEKVGAVPEPLIWAPRSWPSEVAHGIPDPPPPLKGRKAGGVRNGLHRR
jgi:hypothetical protein